MKLKTKILVTLLIAAAAGIPFIAFSAVLPDSSDNSNPEFYFTRLWYQENGLRNRGGFGGGFGRGTMPKPPPYHCPEFGGGNFFPRQGSGWATDYPGADCKFMGGIHRLTGLPVYTHPNIIEIMDPNLFKFPYVYIVEPGGMYISDEEAVRFREFFARGGFLHVDDFWGLRQKANLELQLKKVFPEKRLEVLPLTHEVFHTFYEINEMMQIPNQGNGCYGPPYWEQPDDKEPRIYGISDDHGKLQVVVTYNSDLGDAWEYMDLACYPQKLTGQAYRLGLNFMIYAMTH
jgi:hypothetical protein